MEPCFCNMSYDRLMRQFQDYVLYIMKVITLLCLPVLYSVSCFFFFYRNVLKTSISYCPHNHLTPGKNIPSNKKLFSSSLF